MKTISLNVENLCVPCGCRCRHCLLSYDGKPIGADYVQGKALARRLAAESPISFNYYIGFCMDTPELLDYIAFCQEIGSAGGRFLQMNGFQPRSPEQFAHLMRSIRDAGVELIDLTFYGLPEYHDAFAGRIGDFRLLLQMLEAANAARLPVHISAPITEDNAGQMERLLDLLSAYKPESVSLYQPHAKGRGWALESARLRKSTLDRLPPSVQARMPKAKTQTEAQWLSDGAFPEPQERHLTLSLTPDNFARYRDMPAPNIISELEALDDAFYAALPPVSDLARRYGDPASDKLFRYRDLTLFWAKKFLRENSLPLHDMTNERHHFSARQ